ncbi:hypothetical protein ACFPRL_03900 [Pseudoclavibacter helvolus]
MATTKLCEGYGKPLRTLFTIHRVSVTGNCGLTPFRRSSRYESRPVVRGRGQGDWSDHDEQQEASHPGAGRP